MPRYALFRDTLLLLALVALMVDQSTYLRVLLRATFEGVEFQWGYTAGVSAAGDAAIADGTGLFGHLDLPLTHAVILGWLIVAGCRRPDRYFCVLLFIWTSIAFGLALWSGLTFGQELRVSKETLGLRDVPAIWFSLPPSALAWIASGALLARGLLRRTPVYSINWTGLNSALTLLGLMCLAASYVLLNFGQQHDAFDKAGVAMLYVGFSCVFLGVSPWESRIDPSPR